MRYAKLYDTMWEDPSFRDMSMLGKLAYAYICSCTHCNQIGYFRLPASYMAEDMGVSLEQAKKAIGELRQAGLVLYNDKTGRMLIRSYLKWNAPDSNNNLTSMAKQFDGMVPDQLDGEFLAIADKLCLGKGLNAFSQVSRRASSVMAPRGDGGEGEGKMQAEEASPSPSLTPIPTPGISQKQEQEQEQDISSLRSLAPSCESEPSVPEPPKPDDSQDVLLVLPCTTGAKEWRLTRGYVESVRDAYPGVDILAECRKAKVWLEANPKRGKTYTGMKAFLASWFSKSQNHQPASRLPFGVSQSSLPDSVVHTEEAWAGRKGGKLFMGGAR